MTIEEIRKCAEEALEKAEKLYKDFRLVNWSDLSVVEVSKCGNTWYVLIEEADDYELAKFVSAFIKSKLDFGSDGLIVKCEW